MTFSFLRFPVTIGSSFWTMGILFSLSRLSEPILMVEWILVMGFAIFVHELGHALAFRHYGYDAVIALHGLGGHTSPLGRGQTLTPAKDAVVSFAGPFFGYLLAAVVWGVTKVVDIPAEPGIWSVLVGDLLWVSAGWSTLNLCPILPLDGGHLMHAALRHKLKWRADLPAHVISVIVAIGAMVASGMAGWQWTLYMTAWFTASNLQSVVQIYKARGKKAPPPRKNKPEPARPASSVEALTARGTGPQPTTLSEPLIQARRLALATWITKDELERAAEIARELPDAVLGSDLLRDLADAAFARRAWSLAEIASARRLIGLADPDGGVQAAAAATLDNRIDDAFAWLERALAAGWSDRTAIEKSERFAPLRADPRWSQVMDPAIAPSATTDES